MQWPGRPTFRGAIALIGTSLLIWHMAHVDAYISCILLADCHAKIGDILNEKGDITASDFYEIARYYIRRQEKYDASRLSLINKKCQDKLAECNRRYISATINDINEAELGIHYSDPFLQRLRENIRRKLSCQDYSIYFCRMDEPGYWPEDIYASIKLKYKIKCGETCSTFTVFHEYHLRMGKNFPEDFPAKWGDDLELAKETEIKAETKLWPEFRDKWISDCTTVDTTSYGCWVVYFYESDTREACLNRQSENRKYGIEIDDVHVDKGTVSYHSVSDQIYTCSQNFCSSTNQQPKSDGVKDAFDLKCSYTRCVNRTPSMTILTLDRECYVCPCHRRRASASLGN